MADYDIYNTATIAAMAGVSPGTVSNWRTRPISFPQPLDVPGVSWPLFDGPEVRKWLDSWSTANKGTARLAAYAQFVYNNERSK
jgi:hypothetical protein